MADRKFTIPNRPPVQSHPSYEGVKAVPIREHSDDDQYAEHDN